MVETSPAKPDLADQRPRDYYLPSVSSEVFHRKPQACAIETRTPAASG
jgi:hypothetical protein